MEQDNDTALYERVATLESIYKSQSEKINEIHKALMGNGHSGLLSDFNQFKGAAKAFGGIITIFISLLGIGVGAWYI